MKQPSFAFISRLLAGLVVAVFVAWILTAAFSSPALHLFDLRFNPYAILSGTALLVNVCLILYFIGKPARTDERIWLFVYMTAATVFNAAEFMQRLSATAVGAGFWSNLVAVAAILPVATFLFTLSYTNQSDRRYPWLTSLLLVAPLLYVIFADATNLVYTNGGAQRLPWGWDFGGTLGPAFPSLLFWYIGLNGLGLIRLISFRRRTRNPILRKQSLIFMWAILIPIFAGLVSEGILPLLNINSIPPIGGPVGDLALILLLYGVLKYQLLTISPTLFAGTILSIMQETVVVTDRKLQILYLNPNAEALLGVRADHVSQSSLSPHLTDDSLVSLKQGIDHEPETVSFDHLDIAHEHHLPTPVKMTGSKLLLGKDVAWIMVLTDITKELQTRSVIEHEVKVRTRELHQARAYLISSINSLEQGFVLVNHEGHTELINNVAVRLFGIGAVDMAGGKDLRDVTRTMSWDWDIDLPSVVSKVLESKRSHQQAASATNGSSYEIFVTPVVSGEHILGATIIIQDVTEQRILDRSKDEFFSIASHELRTPLTAIRGNMSMVRDYFPEAMKDNSLASMVTDTHDASVRLISIVNDFLDSSKLEQGKMRFDLKPTSLLPVVEAVQKDLNVILEKQHDKLVLDGLSGLPKVMADEARIRQIVYNLLSNAIKYCENGAITISGEVSGHSLALRFTDTGKGISPEGQKLLFHKFQQASESTLTRDDTKGTGLGLYISRLLANNMQGDVTLEHSEIGKGSSFVLTLPLAS